MFIAILTFYPRNGYFFIVEWMIYLERYPDFPIAVMFETMNSRNRIDRIICNRCIEYPLFSGY